MHRRTFLGKMTVAAFMTSRLVWAASSHKVDRIGLQLYTVRNELKKDFEATIAKVAAIGYKEVEFAGYFGHSPREVRAILDRHDLAAPSTHVGFENLGADWPQILEDAQVIGHHYIVNARIPADVRNQPDSWKRVAENFNRAGEASKKAGIQFAYHNHHFDFVSVGGRLAYNLLLEECDPELVKMEMDLCWIIAAGQDPLAYFRLYPGRFPMVHVKDLQKLPSRTASDTGPITREQILPDLTEVGSGVIDWKTIFERSSEAAIKHYFVEHDQPKSPLDSIKTSYQFLRRLRF